MIDYAPLYRQLFLHFAITVGLATAAFEANNANAQSTKQEAQEAAGYGASALETLKTEGIFEEVPGYQTANPEDLTKHYDEEGTALEAATQEGLANTTDGEGGEAASTIVETYVTRPEVSITKGETWLSQSRGALGDPDVLAGDIYSSSENPACETQTINGHLAEINACDIYQPETEQTCSLGLEVDLNVEKTWGCVRETASYNKVCDETLEVSCKQVLANCRLEDGLLVTAWDDLTITYENYRHRIAFPTEDRGYSCEELTRTATLNIADISKLSVAKLSRLDYADAISVYVNGSFVWGGPYGDGTRENLVGYWRDGALTHDGDGPNYRLGIGSPGGPPSGLGFTVDYLGQCSADRIHNVVLGTDIKPFLVTGANQITFKLASAFRAGFVADFEILMSCCGEWEQTWEQTCPY